jgi:hypothetical protein
MCDVMLAKIRFRSHAQSARLFLQSSELGPPQSLTLRRVCPPPFGSAGGTHPLTGEGWVLGVPIRTRGQTLWYSRYICTLWSQVIRIRAFVT